MATGDETLNIIIKLKDEMTTELNRAKSSLEDLEPAFKKMAAVGTAALAAVGAIAIKSFDAFADAQAQTEITNQSLQNTLDTMSSGSLEKLKEQLGVTGDAFARVANASIAAGDAAVQMGFDDETAARSFAKLFGITKDVTNANKELQLAMDLARYKNISLEEATQKLILVHSGATKELKMLGLAVNDTATAQQNLDSINKQVTGSAQTFAQSAKGGYEQMKVMMDNLSESVGGALAPAFEKLIETVTPIIKKFSDWAAKNPALLSKLILIGGAIAALVAVMGFLGMVLPAVIAGFTLLMGPVGLVIAIIAALIAIVVLIVRHWQDLKEATMAVWNSIVDFFQGVWDSITAAISSAWNAILNFFSAIWEGIKAIFKFQLDLIVGIVVAIFESMGIDIVAVFTAIGQFFIETWQTIKDTFNLAMQELALLWNNVWQAISDFLGPIWEGIKNVVSSGWNWLKDKFVAFAEPVSKAWTGLWSALTTGVTIAWETVKQTVKDSINWIIDKVNKVIEAINAVAAKGAGAIGLGGKAPQIPTIPMLANGGIVNKPTLAMIGEAGPEAVVPLSKGKGAMGGFGGGMNITINYPQFNSPGDESRMKQMLDDYFRPLLINNKMSA